MDRSSHQAEIVPKRSVGWEMKLRIKELFVVNVLFSQAGQENGDQFFHAPLLTASCVTPDEPKQKNTIHVLDLSHSWLQAGSDQVPVLGTARQGPCTEQECQITKPLTTRFLFPFQSYGILLMNWACLLQKIHFSLQSIPFGAVERADGNRHNKILIKCQAIICSE